MQKYLFKYVIARLRGVQKVDIWQMGGVQKVDNGGHYRQQSTVVSLQLVDNKSFGGGCWDVDVEQSAFHLWEPEDRKSGTPAPG